MNKHPYLPQERETVIRWCDDKTAGIHIFTASPTVHRRLERRGLKSYKESRQSGQIVGWFYRYPTPDLSFPLPRVKTPHSPQATAARRASLAKARAPKAQK